MDKLNFLSLSLVLVPHEHTHAPRSILEQARELGPDVTEMRAIKHTKELIAHSRCIANGAPAKVEMQPLAFSAISDLQCKLDEPLQN